jgi:hypothetical protein
MGEAAFIYFPVAFYIEFLCAAALGVAMALRPFVMTLANLQNDRIRLRTVSNSGLRRKTLSPAESVSEAWPGWPTLADSEPQNAAERNRLPIVLWETARAVMISIGMAFIVMAILSVMQFNVGRLSSESLQDLSLPKLLKADRQDNSVSAATSHQKPPGIAARQYAATHSRTRICALIDFRPAGGFPQNAWCIL